MTPFRDQRGPQCFERENEGLCTTALLSTTEEECECYNFCDGELIGCEMYPGTGMHNCTNGTAVIGCNVAGAADYVAPTWPPTPSPTVGEPVFQSIGSGSRPRILPLSARRLGISSALTILLLLGLERIM